MEVRSKKWIVVQDIVISPVAPEDPLPVEVNEHDFTPREVWHWDKLLTFAYPQPMNQKLIDLAREEDLEVRSAYLALKLFRKTSDTSQPSEEIQAPPSQFLFDMTTAKVPVG